MLLHSGESKVLWTAKLVKLQRFVLLLKKNPHPFQEPISALVLLRIPLPISEKGLQVMRRKQESSLVTLIRVLFILSRPTHLPYTSQYNPRSAFSTNPHAALPYNILPPPYPTVPASSTLYPPLGASLFLAASSTPHPAPCPSSSASSSPLPGHSCAARELASQVVPAFQWLADHQNRWGLFFVPPSFNKDTSRTALLLPPTMDYKVGIGQDVLTGDINHSTYFLRKGS